MPRVSRKREGGKTRKAKGFDASLKKGKQEELGAMAKRDAITIIIIIITIVSKIRETGAEASGVLHPEGCIHSRPPEKSQHLTTCWVFLPKTKLIPTT